MQDKQRDEEDRQQQVGRAVLSASRQRRKEGRGRRAAEGRTDRTTWSGPEVPRGGESAHNFQRTAAAFGVVLVLVPVPEPLGAGCCIPAGVGPGPRCVALHAPRRGRSIRGGLWTRTLVRAQPRLLAGRRCDARWSSWCWWMHWWQPRVRFGTGVTPKGS